MSDPDPNELADSKVPQWLREYEVGCGIELYRISLDGFAGRMFAEAVLAIYEQSGRMTDELCTPCFLLALEEEEYSEERGAYHFVVRLCPSQRTVRAGSHGFVLCSTEDAAVEIVAQAAEEHAAEQFQATQRAVTANTRRLDELESLTHKVSSPREP